MPWYFGKCKISRYTVTFCAKYQNTVFSARYTIKITIIIDYVDFIRYVVGFYVILVFCPDLARNTVIFWLPYTVFLRYFDGILWKSLFLDRFQPGPPSRYDTLCLLIHFIPNRWWVRRRFWPIRYIVAAHTFYAKSVDEVPGGSWGRGDPIQYGLLRDGASRGVRERLLTVKLLRFEYCRP